MEQVVVQSGADMWLACPPDPIRTAWQFIGPRGQTWGCRVGGHPGPRHGFSKGAPADSLVD